MLYNAVEVEVIKLATGNSESMGLRSKAVLLGSIVWLRKRYEQTGDEAYLRKAIMHIYAYLDIGYPYDEGKEEFQKIVEYLDMKEEDVFPFKKWRIKKVPLRKGSIRNLLGRWSGPLHSMKINDVVEDIIRNASESRTGEYTYHCGKEIVCERSEKLWMNTFRLYVNNEKSILHNVNENKYYMLEKVKRNDSDSSN